MTGELLITLGNALKDERITATDTAELTGIRNENGDAPKYDVPVVILLTVNAALQDRDYGECVISEIDVD